MSCEIFFVVSVRMLGEILENQKLWDNMVPMEIQATYFCLFCRKNKFNTIKC